MDNIQKPSMKTRSCKQCSSAALFVDRVYWWCSTAAQKYLVPCIFIKIIYTKKKKEQPKKPLSLPALPLLRPPKVPPDAYQ